MSITPEQSQILQALFFTACVIFSGNPYMLGVGIAYLTGLTLILIYGLSSVATLIATGNTSDLAELEVDLEQNPNIRFLTVAIIAVFDYKVYQSGWTVFSGLFIFTIALNFVGNLLYVLGRRSET